MSRFMTIGQATPTASERGAGTGAVLVLGEPGGLGDGEVASETDSLLRLGRICDAHKLAAETLATSIESGG